MNEHLLKNLASQAADDFVVRDRPLNDTLFKMAQEHGLRPNSIYNLTTMANHAVYARLMKTANQKLFEFPLADHKEVMKKLGSRAFHPEIDRGDRLTASRMKDYQSSPDTLLKKLVDRDLDNHLKVASFEASLPFNVPDDDGSALDDQTKFAFMSKVASIRSEILSEIADDRREYDSLLEKIASQIEENLYSTNNGLKAILNGIVDEFDAGDEGSHRFVRDVIKVAMDNLQSKPWLINKISGEKSSDMIKYTDKEKDKPTESIRVVNSSSPMYGSLRRAKQVYDRADRKAKGLTFVDEKVRQFKKEIRN